VKFTQYYLDCLSQASYLIGDETSGTAVIVDPRRDVAEYLADAEADGFRIRYVIETHFHADFLSGHLDLAATTGAEIVYGSAADAHFPHRKVADGERISLGEVVLEFRETPGHTPESISIVVWEHDGDPEPYGVLTGDTLFIGDVGRPDLLASKGVTAEELARSLYRSLHTKLMVLPDSTRVFPAHGAGSACGKNLSTETTSTIGEQRATNYAVQPMGVDEFVTVVTGGQNKAPDYFSYDAGLNREPHALLDLSPPPLLTMAEVAAARDGGAILLDTRSPEEFARGHVRGSVNVGSDGRFAEYAGSVIPPDRDIILLGDTGDSAMAKTRLGRIGFDRVVGALEGVETALAETPGEGEPASRLTAAALAERLRSIPGLQVVDVRNPGEWAGGAIDGSAHIPLSALRGRIGELDLSRPIVVHCAGGYRSSIAASLLRNAGAADVSDLVGGYDAWKAFDSLAGSATAH
jgi:glyoxylase-like metal-dependent hydrolase (beta-lactamase superfamily II)/rhodanese-related sulfurtransferase